MNVITTPKTPTYHIPSWIDMPGDYTWANKGAGVRQVETGGRDKYNFTVQLSCSNIGEKIPT